MEPTQHRRVISDMAWQILNHIFSVVKAHGAVMRETTRSLLMRCFGYCEQAHNGAIYLLIMATGIISTAVLLDGGIKVYGNQSLSAWLVSLILSGL